MRSRGLILAGGLAVVTTIALVPWWRNHAYLRDLFDYGVVMSAAGRVAAGERPFVDFVSPMQSMIFLANWGVEKIAGSSYQALTLGGAAMTAIMAWLLGWIFSRRWSVGVALFLSAVLTVAMASQHLIIFYNIVGGTCLIAVAWAAAIAPRLQREHWAWHVLLAGALWVGGMNKLNIHFVALAVGMAWAVRAGLRRESSWSQMVAMLVFVFIFGVALPLATELAWTGASLKTWYHNVVQIPLRGRSGDLGAALTLKAYLVPHHDYYGPLVIPQMGLLGLVASGWVVVVAGWQAWRRRDMVDVGLAPLAGLLAVGGGMGVLLTNFDIATVAVGIWFGLLTAVWVGFGLPTRGWVIVPGLAFVSLLGITAWPAAWNGQRSQFGHSPAPRSAYVPAETAGEEYAYLRGTRLPPEMRDSMHMLAQWKKSNPEAPARIFYGQGLEWLERIWPAAKVPARPLWMHFGTSYAAKEEEDFYRALWTGQPHHRVLVPIAYDFWPVRERQLLDNYYTKIPMGVYRLYDKPFPEGISGRPIDFLNQFGGNTDPRLVSADLLPVATPGGRAFFGTTHGSGSMNFRVPTYRVTSSAIVCRPTADAVSAVKASFRVLVKPNGAAAQMSWQSDVELAPGEMEKSLDCLIEGGAHPLEFQVEIPKEMDGRIVGGWRMPSPQHTAGETGPAWSLQYPALAESAPDDEVVKALFAGDWQPEKVVCFGGFREGSNLRVRTGGEIWIKAKGALAELSGFVAVADNRDPAASLPVLRACYYKNGRIELQSQNPVRREDGHAEFRMWSPEMDGWFVIAMTGPADALPVTLKILQARRP